MTAERPEMVAVQTAEPATDPASTIAPTAERTPPWADAAHAAAILAIAGRDVGGVHLIAKAGPVRDSWLALLRAALTGHGGLHRLPAGITDDRLLGGLDLTATLRAGRPVVAPGLLAEADGGILVAAMAERMAPATAAHLAAMLDTGRVAFGRDGVSAEHSARAAVVALDESEPGENAVPTVLDERLGLGLDLTTLGLAALEAPGPAASALNGGALAQARDCYAHVVCSRAVVEALTCAAASVGIGSLRPVVHAVAAARAAAALDGRTEVTDADAAFAARLTIAPRARFAPESPAENEADTDDSEAGDPPPDQAQGDDATPDDTLDETSTSQDLREVVLAAVGAALPARLLAPRGDRVRRPPTTSARSGRSGAMREGGLRGRPAGSQRPRGGAVQGRIDLLATLRAAVPWQRLRRRSSHRPQSAVLVSGEDLRITRRRARTEALTIFLVDASGSSALNRLAEAKGAVELLLGECYVRRDSVALIAFRRQAAELLLPPTRSLTRAKRALGALPGGGGTPLAAGLDAALGLAAWSRRRGRSPFLVVLTDAKANVALDGAGGRPKAEADALAVARHIGAEGLDSLLVDISPRPGPAALRIAQAMCARYQPLPRLDAGTLSLAVRRAQAEAAGRAA